MELEEADDEKNEGVRADPSVEHLVQIPLCQELFQDQNQFWENGNWFMKSTMTLTPSIPDTRLKHT